MDFEFHVGGIEDGIIELLDQLYGFRDGNAGGYLKTVASYGGQLDEKVLREFISDLAPMFPLMLVAYGDGEDKLDPATPPVFGQPRMWRHDCTFSVICCDDNARGEKEQRRGDGAAQPGVIKMISDTRDALAGLQFRKADGSEQVLLNLEPFRLAGVEYIARLPQLTAYVQHFDSYFRWTEPDRSIAGTAVSGLIFDVTPMSEASPGGLPGVAIK